MVFIARDDKRLARAAALLRFRLPEAELLRFPAWDCLPYDRVSPNADIAAARMATLSRIQLGMSASEATCHGAVFG